MKPITIERSTWINAPREKVWQAVIDPEKIAQWFAPGAEFLFNGDRVSVKVGEDFVEVAVIEVNDPPRQFTTRNLPGMNLATTYLLEEENGGTWFTVIESGLETLDAAEREKHIAQNSPAWEAILENLKAAAEGRDLPYPNGF